VRDSSQQDWQHKIEVLFHKTSTIIRVSLQIQTTNFKAISLHQPKLAGASACPPTQMDFIITLLTSLYSHKPTQHPFSSYLAVTPDFLSRSHSISSFRILVKSAMVPVAGGGLRWPLCRIKAKRNPPQRADLPFACK